MKMFRTWILMLLATVMLAGPALPASAQDTAKQDTAKKEGQEFKSSTAPTYRLTFTIFELQDGKRVNQRDYNLALSADNGGGNRMRIGTKIPLDIGEGKMTYTDVGFDLECSAVETLDKRLAVRVELNLSSFPTADQNSDPRSAGTRPVLRNISQRVRTALSPGKPQIITSMDDVNSNKRFQVEVTATRID